MLAIEVEYLLGVAFLAEADRRTAEWPPQPDRLFSALVATWADLGQDAGQAEALRWLERLEPPAIVHPQGTARDVADVYVPPNDMTVSGKPGGAIPKELAAAIRTLPQARTNRQARHFPATVLDRDDADRVPPVVYLWRDVTAPPAIRAALAELASALSSLGHSSSLVRAALVEPDGDVAPTLWPDARGDRRLRWVYAGRFDALTQDYAAARDHNREQATRKRGALPLRTVRPAPGISVAYAGGERRESAPQSIFGGDWIVFEDAGGTAPSLTAFAHAAKAVHASLLKFADAPVPEVVSGHRPDGSATDRPHLAIVPLADVDWDYSEGRLFGFALVLPREIEARDPDDGERRQVLAAIGKAARSTPIDDRDAGLRLTLGGALQWCVKRTPYPERASLRPGRYARTARRWATVTPVLLDRHPKAPGEAEDSVAQACVNIGLPVPAEVRLFKHPAVRGAPSAWPAGAAPRQADWSFPADSPLASRRRIHAVVDFDRPVRGPVLLGAGRFRGFGLCLPVDEG